jgi:hypothetical protein
MRLAVLSSFLATPVEKPVLRTPPCNSARTAHANALELVVRVIELEVRHKPLLLADRISAHTAPICLTQSASEHSIHLHLHSKAHIHGTTGNGMLDLFI